MDTDTEDDYASPIPIASTSGSPSSDVIKNLLEIAQSRPGTNVAKAIVAYHEAPGLSNLLLLLEEVSKNTDFSTDLRLSLSYYMDEFLRQISGENVPRRAIIAAAGNVLQYCSKIYGDRVELMYQVVEHQIEALLIAEPKQVENSNNGTNVASKPEEPRKRRAKKLTQREFDPFSYKMEPRKIKIMSDEKRFGIVGFEINANRGRTIEHMYLDHTPAQLWKHASIVDPDNPYEVDEKKNYKLFTYHPEPRYNTLLPDIQFDRLNLIKQFVHTNSVDVSDTLNENMTNKEYLDEYIALENQMLASRYGEIAILKRATDAPNDHDQPKRICMELQNLLKRNMESTHLSPKRRRLSEGSDGDLEAEESGAQITADSGLDDSLRGLTLADSSEVQLNGSQLEGPGLSSTLAMNDSSCLNSTSLQSAEEFQLQLSAGNADDSNDQSIQIDPGIGMEDVSDALIEDNIDEQRRLQLLSPKVMVQDILPGVPDKANLSVRVDAEMLALSGIHETLEEIVQVPRDVHYPTDRNFLMIPEKRLRRVCLFRLTKEFELFKKARLPAKRVPEPRATVVSRTFVGAPPDRSESSLAGYPVLPLDQLEFDLDQNFLGFRRPTYDSGIDQEEIRAELSNSPADDGIVVDVGFDEQPDLNATEAAVQLDEIPQVRSTEHAEKDVTEPEIPLDTLETTALNETLAYNAQDITAKDMTALSALQQDSCLDVTQMDVDTFHVGFDTVDDDADADSDSDENAAENCNSIDEETDAKIIDWHRRLAPTLEAAHARQNFSIQGLNKEIIQKCQERDGEATLADVIEDKDPTKLCCYMLSSLLLTNQGNVALQIGKHDKSKPIEMHQFKMKLLSTEMKQVNPEDDIGNIQNANLATRKPEPQSRIKATTATLRHLESEIDDAAERVHLIKPVPKASERPDDADSGISSLPASISYEK